LLYIYYIMSYIQQQPNNYPSIVELKAKENEILLLLNQYKADHDSIYNRYRTGECDNDPNANCDSTQHCQKIEVDVPIFSSLVGKYVWWDEAQAKIYSQDCPKTCGQCLEGDNIAKSYRGLMINLQNKNSELVGKLNELKDMMAQVYPKGMQNDSLVEMIDKEQLVELSTQLNAESVKMTKLINELNTYDGENEILILKQKSYYMQYLVFMGLSICFIYLIIKAYSTNNVSNIENLILLVVIVLLVYYLWFKWSRGNLYNSRIRNLFNSVI
jgi:hypothetical protein